MDDKMEAALKEWAEAKEAFRLADDHAQQAYKRKVDAEAKLEAVWIVSSRSNKQ